MSRFMILIDCTCIVLYSELSNFEISNFEEIDLQSYLQINPDQPQHLASEPSTTSKLQIFL